MIAFVMIGRDVLGQGLPEAPIVVGQQQASAPQLAAKHTILFKQITKDISFLAIQPSGKEREHQLERGGGEHGRSLYHGRKTCRCPAIQSWDITSSRGTKPFERYNIVSDGDLRSAATQLSGLTGTKQGQFGDQPPGKKSNAAQIP
jgi:hypothetical protein